MIRRVLVLLSLLMVLAVQPATADTAPLPVEVFATPSMASGLDLSPDGNHVAYLAPLKGRHILVIRKRLAAEGEKPILIGAGDWNIHRFDWVNNERLIISVGTTKFGDKSKRKYPARFTRLMAVNRDGSDMRVVLEPEPERRHPFRIGDDVIQFVDDSHVLMVYPTPGDPILDVVKVNVYTGEYTRVVRGFPSIYSYLPDPSGQVRLASRFDDGDSTEVFLIRANMRSDFKTFHRMSLEKGPLFDVLGFGENPDILYVASTHESDRTAIYEYDLRTGQMGAAVASDPEYDVAGAVMRRGRVVGITYMRDMPVQILLDPAAQKLQQQLDKAIPDSTEILIDTAADGRFALIASFHPAEPVTYRIFDKTTRELAFFADSFPGLPPDQVATRQSVRYAARDGLQIPAYLTLPPGRTPKALPFIVMPHGGPMARDTQIFDTHSQFLASRGYGVLQPNFRGSTGYGQTFGLAGAGEWGGKMQTDVLDGVRWAIDQGIADPNRICIVGWSYGGYSALMGAIQSPDLFRCAVATAPVTDLLRMLKDTRWFLGRDHIRSLLFAGRDRDALRAHSPVYLADRVSIPVLLIHGDKDVQAEVVESREMVEALKKAGKPHEYIEIEDMDHSPDSAEQMVRILTAWERFLATHIGPGAPRTGP